VVSLGKLGRVESQTDPANGSTMNHNVTVAFDENEDDAETAPLADLKVSEQQAEQAKGGIGMLLPAVQKVR
jgi:hypothetical protein